MAAYLDDIYASADDSSRDALRHPGSLAPLAAGTNFRTDSFAITVTMHDDGTWSCKEDFVRQHSGQAEPFDHPNSNRLIPSAGPTPNPLAG